MKRLVSILISFVMLASGILNLGAFASKEIFYDGAWHTYSGNFFDLKINGQKINCSVPPIVFNDYSVVPARDVFETLGASVLWRAEYQRVIIQYGKTELILTVNNKTAYKNGIAEKMPIAPKIINSKTMIPVRYVSESLGFSVNFDSKTDTISIYAGNIEVPETSTPETPETPEVTTPTYASKITSFSASEANGTFSAIFNLSASGVKYSSFTLNNPERLVVDLKSTNRASSVKDTDCTSAVVSKIRFGQQADGTLRIVFDLPQKSEHKVTLLGKQLTVVIGDISSYVPPVQTEPEEPEIVEIDIEPSRSITIDPGHGGSDPGAIFTEEDGTVWRETDINLAVSLKVRDILEANGVRVVMTRTTEKDVVRRDRPELANKEKTALFISIHTNSVANNDAASGIETWGSLEINTILSGVNDKLFAQNVQNSVIKATGAKNRGIKNSEDLTVLVYSVMPSVLIEVGFITNEEERGKMFNDVYRDKLAEGIAEGILKTFDDMGV